MTVVASTNSMLLAPQKIVQKTLITIAITILFSFISSGALFEWYQQSRQAEASEILEIDSSILGEKRRVLIHLPKNYNKSKTYPVLYVLDGSSQDFRMAAIIEILNYTELVPEMIIVGIPNTDRNRDLTPHYILQETNGESLGQGNTFLDFLEKELLPKITDTYPANGYAMLAGHSRAALFTYYAAMERSDLFDTYFCFSPAFWRDESAIVKRARELYAISLPQNNVFMSMGTAENDKMKSAYEEMIQLLEDQDTSMFRHFYTQDAHHQDNLYFSTPRAMVEWAKTYPPTYQTENQ